MYSYAVLHEELLSWLCRRLSAALEKVPTEEVTWQVNVMTLCRGGGGEAVELNVVYTWVEVCSFMVFVCVFVKKKWSV